MHYNYIDVLAVAGLVTIIDTGSTLFCCCFRIIHTGSGG